MAEEVAATSPDPFMKVGCVGVNSHRDQLIAVGSNHMPGHNNDPIWNDRDARRPLVVHAEIRMCAAILAGTIDEVYLTLFPCCNCMLTLVQHGVKRIVYKDIYDKDRAALNIARFYGVKCERLCVIKNEEIS